MKKVAITHRLVGNEAYPEIRDALDIRWTELCVALSVLPVPVPTGVNFASFVHEIGISGIILTGGNDLAQFSNDQLSKTRDSFEGEVLTLATQEKIPVIGVCRGMQLIAAYFGATLAEVPHHSGTRHPISTVPGSRFLEGMLMGREVNSFHRYCVTNGGKEVMTSAKSTDGVIEAVEHPVLPFFGQMWHPEREIPFIRWQLDVFRKVFRLEEEW